MCIVISYNVLRNENAMTENSGSLTILLVLLGQTQYSYAPR